MQKTKSLLDNHTIGELKALKFNIALTAKTLDTDIKSIKKAARKSIGEELSKRVEEIIEKKEIHINEKNYIVWKDNPIARLKKGHDYLNPTIETISDEAISNDLRLKLDSFLKEWLHHYMREILGDLINLTDLKIKNQYLRALAFQLFEKNGVIKRDEINNIIKKIPEAERKLLWGMGIKIGRYHVYLPKMLKPKAVTFRVSLWNLFNNFQTNFDIPKFGLNFLEKSKINQELLLLCGFEKFKEFFVRIDILEKLFSKLLKKQKKINFKLTPQ